MRDVLRRAVDNGIEAIAFGDLFLRDIREYRERQLKDTSLQPLFPLWDIPTDQLASDMIRSGLKAKLTCIDPKKLDRSFAGRNFDTALIRDLPSSVDPCGENGEFHTFAFEGPPFERRLDVRTGEIVERDGFVFADVLGGRVDVG
jgi:diphthamide synthase (EF-2-diphthine--ammonia ligase)